jgi:aminoglycoside phosphotransferase (APT) family kinase protein
VDPDTAAASRAEPAGGAPARHGDTVLRPVAPWTASVHALLAHLRARGVDWVPEPRGVAGPTASLAAVSWVEGDVPAYPMPAYVWEPAVLDRAAAMLRELHDATGGFDRSGRVWALPAREPAEVICHNDFAPYNLAFRDGLPVGAIDFEAASPGPRAWDLAYLAYRLVPLAHPANPDLPPQPDAAARLARLCTAYGGIAPADVLALVPQRLRELAASAPSDHAERYLTDAAALNPQLFASGRTTADSATRGRG